MSSATSSMSMGQAISHYNLPEGCYTDVEVNELVSTSNVTSEKLTEVFTAIKQMQATRKLFVGCAVAQNADAKASYRAAFEAMKRTFNITGISDSFYADVSSIEDLEAKHEQLDKATKEAIAKAEQDQKEMEEFQNNGGW